MKLLVIGTAGYHPNERRDTACLMLPEAGIVLDAGTGFFRVREHLASPTLDILLTHAHLDHVVGLSYLLSTTWQRPLGRITVHGEAEKLAAIREHLLSQRLFPAPLPCWWQPLAEHRRPHAPREESVSQSETPTVDQPLTIGGARITLFPLAHPGGSVGYRLDWPDRSLAYVTDTTAAADAPYVEAIRGVSVLVHECNFRDGEEEWAAKTGHSTTTPVAQVAAAARVGRLILTHFNPLDDSDDPVDLAAARRVFPATELAFDGMAVEF
jgi:ribonuclease BN (tRNA processing enzyme)